MIFVLPGFSFESNAYVVVGEETAVIDPGIDAERVLSFLKERGFSLGYVVNTHCHFDHAGADKAVCGRTGAKLIAHELDAVSIETGGREVLSDLFSSCFEKVRVDVRVREGSIIDLGGIVLRVVYTPGHTRGSMCLIDESSGSFFSGDTVFADGVGRTDFPGGNASKLSSSLKRISRLANEGKIKGVYPGHGSVFSGERMRK